MSRRAAARGDAPSPAETITNAIIARLEAGTKPWVRPWTGQARVRPLRACGAPYRGMNFFWLGMIADMMGYRSATWMTYRQSAALGGQVRKGEKATIAIFYKSYGKTVEDGATGEERTEAHRVLRTYPVFCVVQIDGLPERYYPAPVHAVPAPDLAPAHRADIQAFFDAIPADVRHGGDRAFFHPGQDFIQLPPIESFASYAGYAAIRCHELSHFAGGAERLNRQFGQRFGNEAYCIEELTAELSAAILGSELNLPVALLDNHANYVASWIRVLKSDARALLHVASKAEECANYLLRLAGRGTDSLTETETGDSAMDEDGSSMREAA